jgi:hypothetical protein
MQDWLFYYSWSYLKKDMNHQMNLKINKNQSHNWHVCFKECMDIMCDLMV